MNYPSSPGSFFASGCAAESFEKLFNGSICHRERQHNKKKNMFTDLQTSVPFPTPTMAILLPGDPPPEEEQASSLRDRMAAVGLAKTNELFAANRLTSARTHARTNERTNASTQAPKQPAKTTEPTKPTRHSVGAICRGA